MGKCPHCGSKNIRRRYQEHRRYKWRCRRCNRVFRRPKSGILLWLGVVVVVVVVAAFFAVQQGMIVLPAALSPVERQIEDTSETVSTSMADSAPKVQATIDASVRSAAKAVSGSIATTATPHATLVRKSAAASVTPTVTSTPSFTPTAMPPTPVPHPHLRHLAQKQFMLELINIERKKAGVPLVELGDNNAAQLHAESALANCFSSHWGIDGLKPYMRYSLAGGYQSNAENGHGSDYCIKASDGYRALGSSIEEVLQAMAGWMSSSGHRRNILDKHHKKVNIGLAWDRYNFLAYQHFEGDYVEYDELPSIENGVLHISGRTKNGAKFDGAVLDYDPPPRPLTRSAVAKTYAYCYGVTVAGFIRPQSGGRKWDPGTFDANYDGCPGDPYGTTYDENLKTDWIIAERWAVASDSFEIKADIAEVLQKYNEGVYTILIWGKIRGEDAVISEYSIFHGITPTDAYSPR